MGQKIVVGPINQGARTDRLPFNIDNDSFPVLINAYQWRGRVKRKRGTTPLVRLSRYFNSSSTAYTSTSTITFDGSGVANLLTGFSLQSNGSIIPGSVTITGSAGPTVYTDPLVNGYLTPTGTGGVNTINYASGVITIPAQANVTATAIFRYYPNLPVLGLRDFQIDPSDFPKTLAFDQKYSYNITTTNTSLVYDVSFYKNPASSAPYTAKTTWTPTSWNGGDYNQFWSTNYQGAFWVTNGVNIPFNQSSTSTGLQYKTITTVNNITVGPPQTVDITFSSSAGLVIGDYIFVNEVATTTGINLQTGYVTAINVGGNPAIVTVAFPNSVITNNGSGGMAQYLTNRTDVTKDCIRWYDGDPTNGSSTSPGFVNGKGWVNFMPPISQTAFSIADAPAAIYYLAGCRMIVPFKDRLLFIGPVIQDAKGGLPIYLQDTVIYSQNGTPYYTGNFNGTSATAPTLATTVFYPELVPVNQTATAPAYFSDSTGFGGFVTAGLSQDINTCSSNQDVLLMGFDNVQTRFVYTGDDILPFQFYLINSEYGSSSTFACINMDEGVLTRGDRGYTMTTQTSCGRFDMEIPDRVFQVRLKDNGPERFCSQRDFINEWIYFTFPSNGVQYKFPNQTLQYNYRDKSWALFNESYTTYGQFRKTTGVTWATLDVGTWKKWDSPWNSGQTTVLQPDVIAGNQQGFVVIRDNGTTNETESLYIKSFSGSTITSPAHCLRTGEYIVISGCLGDIGAIVNGNIYKVKAVNEDSFQITPPIASGTYFGSGLITKMYVPSIQTKQFPLGWADARKTRLGVQQYLLTATNNSQIQLLIYLSQNSTSAYNEGFICPNPSSVNNGLVYSTVLYTCPESTNLGLTAANTNLQMVTAEAQQEIWHRVNTSLLGDSIQIGFTLSEDQMRDTEFTSQFAEIELHGFILDVSPSMVIA